MTPYITRVLAQQIVNTVKEMCIRDSPSCGRQEYPVLMPAVIVGITNGDKIICSKYEGRSFKQYALIAGFAEIGETIEETVHREVMEEVGLKVKNLRYYKSQPWSFSGTLLFGFFCDVDGDDTLTVDHEELSVAQWFDRDKIICQDTGSSLTNDCLLYTSISERYMKIPP